MGRRKNVTWLVVNFPPTLKCELSRWPLGGAAQTRNLPSPARKPAARKEMNSAKLEMESAIKMNTYEGFEQ